MKDHAFYLWMSYGAAFLAIAVELAWLRIARARALEHVEKERDLEEQD